MSGVIRRTKAAINDLDSQAAFLGPENLALQLRFLEAAQDTFAKLAASPELGAVYPLENERLAEVRVWQIKGFRNHLVFYRVIDGGVEVLRVFHAAQDWLTILEDG